MWVVQKGCLGNILPGLGLCAQSDCEFTFVFIVHVDVAAISHMMMMFTMHSIGYAALFLSVIQYATVSVCVVCISKRAYV